MLQAQKCYVWPQKSTFGLAEKSLPRYLKYGILELLSNLWVFVTTGSRVGQIFILVYVHDIIVLAFSKLILIMSRESSRSYTKFVCRMQWIGSLVWSCIGTRNVTERWKIWYSHSHYIPRECCPVLVWRTSNRYQQQGLIISGTSTNSEVDHSIVNAELYQKRIGSLLLLALRTRLDIMPAVSILSWFQNTPTRYFHQAAKRVLRYLRGETYGITYKPWNMLIEVFVDSDYAGDVKDRK